jgi:hypothetical protein
MSETCGGRFKAGVLFFYHPESEEGSEELVKGSWIIVN